MRSGGPDPARLRPGWGVRGVWHCRILGRQRRVVRGGGDRAGRGDVQSHRPSRAGRQRRLCRGLRRSGARPPAPVDHRSLPARPPADDLGGQPLRHHLQRRGLQFPRAARRARIARPSLSRRLRHRGDARGLRRLGRREGGDALRRHVRDRPVGPADAHALPHPRPHRREAALLVPASRRAAVRLRAQGADGASRLAGRDRHRGGRRLRALQLRPDAGDHLPQRAQAPAREHPRGAGRRDAAHRALLAAARRRRGGRRPLRRTARRKRPRSSRRSCATACAAA